MPSNQDVFEKADQSSHHHTKKKNADNNEDDDRLNYLPKMHSVYRLSSTKIYDLDLYGNE